MSTLISNESFCMRTITHPLKSTQVYLCELLPVDPVIEHLQLLQNSLEMICNNKIKKSSVIIDCSLLLKKKLIKRFLQGSLTNLMSIENPIGLDKFIIVTSSPIVKVFSSGIIKLKKADHYTKICASMQDALKEL